VKAPALVVVEQPAEAFAALLAVAARRGVRAGWLDLVATAEPPPQLAGAAASGAAKAVVVAPQGALAWKRRAGAAVLRDLVREHFLGFAFVLVRGGAGTPRLDPDGDGFRLSTSPAGGRHYAPDALVDELLRPRHRA
jgi:hypothetical protein